MNPEETAKISLALTPSLRARLYISDYKSLLHLLPSLKGLGIQEKQGPLLATGLLPILWLPWQQCQHPSSSSPASRLCIPPSPVTSDEGQGLRPSHGAAGEQKKRKAKKRQVRIRWGWRGFWVPTSLGNFVPFSQCLFGFLDTQSTSSVVLRVSHPLPYFEFSINEGSSCGRFALLVFLHPTLAGQAHTTASLASQQILHYCLKSHPPQPILLLCFLFCFVLFCSCFQDKKERPHNTALAVLELDL